ncbi:MAG TPA: winged helix DNA-binding domain-containing protein [Roseiflexaceae bacterium]|nr:winged helix DNA-binding domain-containing protein [Roseiflexaceae bacterium]
MTAPAIRQQRLAQQRLTHNQLQTPAEVVSWLGAVQAQDYAGALWSLGMRMRAATEAAVEQAFAEGAILRTHLMRPTWHFVAPADICWLLALTAPRVKAQLAYNDRRWGIDEALIRRCNSLIADALRDQHRTRSELGAVLAGAGIDAEGYRLGQLMIHAELDGIVCSGPRRGKQFTYALLEERVPPAPPLGREEAVAALTRRYFTAHGPATVQDFVWWSGLTVADAKAGLAAVGTELDQTVVDGQTYWSAASPLPEAQAADVALLLPTFDEFLVGYASFDAERRGGRGADRQLVFESTVVIGGQVTGSWRRTLKKQALVEVAPFEPLNAAQHAAVVAAAQRYGAFVGLPAQSTIISAEDIPE